MNFLELLCCLRRYPEISNDDSSLQRNRPLELLDQEVVDVTNDLESGGDDGDPTSRKGEEDGMALKKNGINDDSSS